MREKERERERGPDEREERYSLLLTLNIRKVSVLKLRKTKGRRKN